MRTQAVSSGSISSSPADAPSEGPPGRATGAPLSSPLTALCPSGTGSDTGPSPPSFPTLPCYKSFLRVPEHFSQRKGGESWWHAALHWAASRTPASPFRRGGAHGLRLQVWGQALPPTHCDLGQRNQLCCPSVSLSAKWDGEHSAYLSDSPSGLNGVIDMETLFRNVNTFKYEYG